MSYQKSTSTDPEDLVSDLFTFLTGTPGWTQLYLDTVNNRAAITKTGVTGELTFGFEWDTTSVCICGFDGTVSPVVNQKNHLQPGSSQAVSYSSEISAVQRMNTINGPYQNVWFFEDDNYCHVVVEYATGQFRHMGFGEIIKVGSWTGGQYQYATYWNQTTAHIDNPASGVNQGWWTHFQAVTSGQGTLHLKCGPSFPGAFDAATKWLFEDDATTQLDADGDRKGFLWNGGGYQTGFLSYAASLPVGQYNGFKPLFPEPLFQVNAQVTPDNWWLLGYLPDRRYVNMNGLNPGEEITVGSEIWVPFPVVRKRYSPGDDTEQSYNFGVAYRKVTT